MKRLVQSRGAIEIIAPFLLEMTLRYADAAKAQKKSGLSPADLSGMPIDLTYLQQDRFFQLINQELPNIHESVESEIDRPSTLMQMMFHKVVSQSSFLGKL